MSRRNLILLIIILIAILGIILWLFSSKSAPIPNETDNGGFFSRINPFGKTTVIPPKESPPFTDQDNENLPTEQEKKKLIKVSSMPIAGYTVFSKERQIEEGPKEFQPFLRYVERENGNIYETYADEIKEVKFSNTIISRVYEALFSNNGDSVIMRYLKWDNRTIQTFLSTLPKGKIGEDDVNTVDITGSFLSDNISDLSLSPDSTKIFYLVNNGENISGITLSPKDGKKTQVIASPFTEWMPSWGGNMLFLTTKPSGIVPGYVYKIEAGKLSKVVGNINGLNMLPSPNGKMLLLSNNGLSLNIYNLNTKETSTLSLRTQSEKCVWAKDNINIFCAVPKNITGGLYPDAWYQGEISFDDQIWEINTQNQNANLIVDLSLLNGGEEIDGVKLMLDSNENYLFFVNKKDSFLWEYRLK